MEKRLNYGKADKGGSDSEIIIRKQDANGPEVPFYCLTLLI